jgi:hypothetical protein
VNAKANFAMSASDVKRTCDSAWNSRLVSGTAESVHEDDSGERVNVTVIVTWDLAPGRKLRRVNVHSVAAGEVPGTIGAAAHQPLPPPGHAGDVDAEQDGGRRHRNFTAYSESGSSVSPDTAHNVVERPRRRRAECCGKRRMYFSPWAGTYRADCRRYRPLLGSRSSSARTLGRPSLPGGRTASSWQ